MVHRSISSVTVFCLALALAFGASGAVAQPAADVECDGCVGESDLANRAVTRTKIDLGAVNRGRLANDAVTTEKIKNGEVATADIAIGAVNRGRLADDAVTTEKIRNGAVATADIALGAVSRSRLRDNAVSTEKIQSGAVTPAKLAPDLQSIVFPAARNFLVLLFGDEEVGNVVTDATGLGHFQYSDDTLQVRFQLYVNDIANITAAHIHCGAFGVNGAVGATLSGASAVTTGLMASGAIDEPDDGNACGWIDLTDVIDAILAGGAYVNIHTSANTGGEVRGQLR